MAPLRPLTADRPDKKDKKALELIESWGKKKKLPFAKPKFPSELIEYLQENTFLVAVKSVPTPSGGVFPCDVKFEGGQIDISVSSTGTPSQGSGCYLVRVAKRDGTGGPAVQTFTNNFETVDLKNPAAPLVATVKLSGCSFVIGQDNENEDVLYLGHAEPAGGPTGTQSDDLKTHFESAALNNVFQGKILKRKWVIGGGGSHKKVLGWVIGDGGSNRKLVLAVQTITPGGPVERFEILEFPPSEGPSPYRPYVYSSTS